MPETVELPVTGAPLPPNFRGTPQEFFETILERMRVVFPTGQTSFVISDTQPTSNVGPWFNTSTTPASLYVYDEADKTYLPLNISPSWPFTISAAEPTDDNDGLTPLWLRIKGTRAIGWYMWNGTIWIQLGQTRGTTVQRPSDPVDYERYWDTDIRSEIYYFGGQWRTLSGSPGDIKQVVYGTLAEALQYNPGWQEFGQYVVDDDARGRALVPANKDEGGAPVVNLPVGAGITSRAAGDKFGAETHTLTLPETPAHTHTLPDPIGKASFDNLSNGPDGGLKSSNPSTPTGSAGGGGAHNNLGPRYAVWTLVKL